MAWTWARSRFHLRSSFRFMSPRLIITVFFRMMLEVYFPSIVLPNLTIVDTQKSHFHQKFIEKKRRRNVRKILNTDMKVMCRGHRMRFLSTHIDFNFLLHELPSNIEIYYSNMFNIMPISLMLYVALMERTISSFSSKVLLCYVWISRAFHKWNTPSAPSFRRY